MPNDLLPGLSRIRLKRAALMVFAAIELRKMGYRRTDALKVARYDIERAIYFKERVAHAD